MRTVYIAWADYQRRAVSMRFFMNFELFHLSPKRGGKMRKLLGYARQTIQTFQILNRTKPDSVWVQLPPNFIPHILLFYRFITFSKFKVVLDLHNASLRKPWSDIPMLELLCNRCDAVTVHNNSVVDHIPFKVKAPTKLFVLEDPPSNFKEGQRFEGTSEKFVLIPCSFHDDEPIDMVLVAARALPNIRFKITGKLEAARKKGYLDAEIANVEFTGFVSEEEFNLLLHTATLVAGITTYENIQLSVASEAIGAGKALILSDTEILKELFDDCALFFKNTSECFSGAVEKAIECRGDLEEKTRVSLVKRNSNWSQKIDSFRGELF